MFKGRGAQIRAAHPRHAERAYQATAVRASD